MSLSPSTSVAVATVDRGTCRKKEGKKLAATFALPRDVTAIFMSSGLFELTMSLMDPPPTFPTCLPTRNSPELSNGLSAEPLPDRVHGLVADSEKARQNVVLELSSTYGGADSSAFFEERLDFRICERLVERFSQDLDALAWYAGRR